MSEHKWKIGDWTEHDGVRYLVFDVVDGEPLLVTQNGCIWGPVINRRLKPLPDCTGWDWQPPTPQYRPYENQAECIEHLHGKLIVSNRSPTVARTIAAFYECTVHTFYTGIVGYKELLSDWIMYDTKEPCGVKQ